MTIVSILCPVRIVRVVRSNLFFCKEVVKPVENYRNCSFVPGLFFQTSRKITQAFRHVPAGTKKLSTKATTCFPLEEIVFN